jgi:thioredoxin
MEKTQRAPTDATSDTFDTLLKTHGLVVVDFWADWCRPCHAFAPVFEKAAEAHPTITFLRVNTDAESSLSERFQIRSIPTVMAFREGRVIHRSSGSMSGGALDTLLRGIDALDPKTVAERDANREKTARGERPAGVATDAEWDEDEELWSQGTNDDSGKQGTWRFWRADGTFASEAQCKDDELHGTRRELHEDGTVAFEGSFSDGVRQGTHRFFAPKGYSTVRMPFREVAANVARIEVDHSSDGRGIALRAFTADGARCIAATGEPLPERPAALPADAEFDEDERLFISAALKDGNYHGVVRKWDRNGRLEREMHYEEGWPDGPYLAFVEGSYRSPDVKYERGTMRRGLAAGKWEKLDLDQKPLPNGTTDLGAPPSEEQLWESEALASRSASAEEWTSIAERLVTEGRVAEAALATARAAGVRHDTSRLVRFADKHTLVRSEESAIHLARSVSDGGIAQLANAILRGGRLPSLLQLVGIACDRRRRPAAALDFIDAALAFVPSEHPYLRSRALVLLELGRPEDVPATCEALEKVSPDDAALFRQYARMLFPKFDFWPARGDLLTAEPSDRKIAQPLEAIQHAIGVYATRVDLVREAVNGILAERGVTKAMSWAIPDVSALLPSGRLELASDRSVTVAGEEQTIDELLDPSGDTLRNLLAMARDEWAGLTTLLWAAGADTLALPTRLVPRPEFGRLDAGVTGFLARLDDDDAPSDPAQALEGIPLDDMTSQTRGMARNHVGELAILFEWLTDAEQASPWQSDLRGNDDDDDDDD